MHNATQLVRKAHEDRMRDRVEEEVENLLLSAIIGPEVRRRPPARLCGRGAQPCAPNAQSPGSQRDRETWRQLLRAGELEDRNVVVNLPVNRGGNGGNGFVMDSGNSVSLRDVVEQLSRSGRPRGNETRTVTVADARVALRDAEVERQLENVNVEAEALTSCEQRGIVFIDELDKICTTSDYRGSDASAEGVQRDLLPLIEGSSIPTKCARGRALPPTGPLITHPAGAAPSTRTTFSSSRPAPSTRAGPRTCSPSCRAASPSAWSCSGSPKQTSSAFLTSLRQTSFASRCGPRCTRPRPPFSPLPHRAARHLRPLPGGADENRGHRPGV